MSLLLIQLSDFHFRFPEDSAANRALAVKKAVLAKVSAPDACFLLLSGDIARTGAKREYEVAERFLGQLRKELTDAGISIVHTVAVPGNHDLNLREEDDTRQLLLESPEKYVSKRVDFKGQNFKSIISVQNEFFQFESILSGKPVLTDPEKLHYLREYQIGDISVVFHCFNTAWLSRKNEIQAKLYLPEEVLTGKTAAATKLSVAIFHHPYTWLDANNQKLLRNFVETNADVVLTGHEHEAGAERYLSMNGQGLDYLRAPAFDDPDLPENGFQILVADFENQSQQMYVFEWEGSRFTETNSASWELHRNSRRLSNPFALRPEFIATLRDMGTGFRHPRCVPPQCELRLRDLYVYPDLMPEKLDKLGNNKSGSTQNISAETLPSFLKIHPQLLIFGADDSGKTALARVLFEDLREKGVCPLLLKGERLKGITEDPALVKALSSAIVEQYATDSAEPYLQAEPLHLAVLIDGFDKAKLTKEAQATLLELLKHRFGTIVVIASDLFRIQEMATTTQGSPFAGFERCMIKAFGRYHRQKLIRAWLSLGRETSDEVDGIHKEVVQTDKTISTLLGKNVLPHFPVTILTLLQMMGNKETTNTANGAYGYMYEVLLKSALAGVNPRDVDEKITYISGIGYYMFKTKEPVLTEEELRQVHLEYCDRYDMVRDFSKMLSDLIKAEVLVETRGSYRFKYPYEYYYSTAKYFQDHATSLRKELYNVADHLYGEANANVLIFYVYLTKDEELIRHLVEESKKIYTKHKPCDMQADVEVINKLAKMKPPPLILEAGGASDHRDDHNKRRDAVEDEGPTVEVEDADVTYNEQLQEIVKISIALKTLQILGQVLRNFTGSLEGPLKLSITTECYELGLRALTAILSFASSDIEGMRQYLGSLIAERTGITDSEELATKADDAIVWLGTACAFGMVKRISYAVGHSDLTNTYRRILENAGNLSIQVVDAAIKLDHFDRIPEKELNKLEPKVKKNYFAYSVIRDLVADHLYLYDVDFPTMQALGAKWDIGISAPQFLSNRSKK